MPSSSILLLETDAVAEEAIRKVLAGVGYAVATVTDPAAAFAGAAEHTA